MRSSRLGLCPVFSQHAQKMNMAKRRKAIENRVTRIKQYLFDNMRHAGRQKVECPYFNIAIRNHPPPYKKAIQEALETGRDIPGTRLVRNPSLRIQSPYLYVKTRNDCLSREVMK